ELIERRDVIEKIVQAEEAAFRRTLDRGLQKLGEELDRVKAEGANRLDDAFVGNLYATDGFPIDLTRLIADESNISVDEERAHAWVLETHGAAESKIGDAAVDAIYKKLYDEHGATRFVGYDGERGEARVLAIVREGAAVERASAGERVDIIVDQTPFYARAGGQVGDTGTIRVESGRAKVLDTTKPGGSLWVHHVEVAEGGIAVGDTAALEVDGTRRQKIKLNHSATHLLHHALRTVLGPHVAQKGSEVAPERLRFDFSHFEGLTTEEIERVEALVNAQIRRNDVSRTDELPFEEAKRAGAMALFGEKYGDRVRVVRIGSESVELCGGTHVARAGDIGQFRVTAEEPLALGVRRIVCVTGEGALAHDQTRERQLREAALTLKVAPDDVATRAEKLLAQLKKQEREIADLRQQLATGGGTDLMQQVRDVGGIKVLATRVDAADPKTLRDAGDKLRDKIGSGVIVLGGEHNGKATLLAMVSKDLAKKVHAGKLVGKLAEMLDGRGGGRPDMAQAGGPNLDKLDEAIEATYGLVEQS
ncbi:MAG: alanine--tRNA ligase, partial [Myxococcales bacterium]|nr:alanine--tRNA ligase [Myxococcales bacterium]